MKGKIEMEIDVIQQLEGLMEAFGLKVDRVGLQYPGTDQFNLKIRKLLYGSCDYKAEIQKMEQSYQENVVYMIKDIFETHYLSMLLPEEFRKSEGKEFLHIGPYITRNPEELLDENMEKHEFPPYLRKELKEYYYGIPLIQMENVLEEIFVKQIGYICKGEIRTERVENADVEHFSVKNLIIESEGKISMTLIEEKYRYEEQMMAAIRSGNLEQLVDANKAFANHPVMKRCEDGLRNGKNMMVICNTLFRKAVQEAGVHPAHIDHISEQFARRIESCTHVSELEKISREMMRKYCLLVRNHSLKGYSAIIRDTLNYIDFHLKEPLSLKILAEKINANASYLSSQFRRETGKTVTDYINENRIHQSLLFLAATDMPIQMVAEQVGIYDENYFSRLFKKYQKQTAKQYRELMQRKK